MRSPFFAVVGALDEAITERDNLLRNLSESATEAGESTTSSSLLKIMQETKRKRIEELDKFIEALRDEYHRYVVTKCIYDDRGYCVYVCASVRVCAVRACV